MNGSSIATRLRQGIPKEEMGPFVSREAVPAYFIAAATSLAIVLTFAFTSFSLATPIPAQLGLLAVLLIACGMLARRYRLGRVGLLLEGIGLIGLMSLVCQLGSILLCASPMPLADRWLASADAAIGFDWFGMIRFLQRHDDVLAAAEYLYHALTWQPGLVVLLLFLTRQDARCWAFLTAWGITLTITLAIWPFVPAISAFPYYGVPHSALPHMVGRLPWAVPGVIEPIRSGSLRSIDLDTFIGLVSFPSFHAGGATLLAWAMLRTRWLWPAFVLLNIGVTGSALVDGSHYLVDLIAGVTLASASIAAAKVILRGKSDDHLIVAGR